MNCSFYDLISSSVLTYQLDFYVDLQQVLDNEDHKLNFLNDHLPIISIGIEVYRKEWPEETV